VKVKCALFALMIVGCKPDKPAPKPYWPSQLRTTPSLCYLAKTNDYHVLATPLVIHDPIQISEPDWPGQVFWSTLVEWRVDAAVRGMAPPAGTLISTHFIGPFATRSQRVIGVKSRGDRLFTDLDDDSSFAVVGRGLQRVGSRFSDLAELTAGLSDSAVDCEPLYAPTPNPEALEFAPRTPFDAGAGSTYERPRLAPTVDPE
jgi:hypothetical protein